MTKLLRSYLGTFFECESHALAMQVGSFRDKAYREYAAERNWTLARQAWIAAERGF